MSAPARKLRVVGGGEDFTKEFRRALSAACGKHIGDEYRAEILGRDFGPMHIRADRAPALRLPANWKAPR